MSLDALIFLLSILPVYSAASCSITNCAQCNGNSAPKCNSCNDGFWLEGNVCKQCPSHCSLCTHSTECKSCVTSYWNPGQLCNFVCSSNCKDSDCEDTTGYCNKCYQGKYGYTCEQYCSLCINGECDLQKCRLGCKDGYAQYNTDTGYSSCHQCSSNCIQCSNTTYCSQCEQGFYGIYYRNTIGRGTRTCTLCWEQCTQCTSIDQCPDCNSECIKQGCDESGGCVTTRSTSNTTSSTKASTSSKITLPVTENNQSTVPTNATGTIADPPSSTSKDASETSTTSTKTSEVPQADTNKSTMLIGAAAGGGTLVLLVIVVVFIVCFIKRRSNKNAENQVEGSASNQKNVELDYPVYAKPNKPSGSHEVPTEDYLYAQPNKPLKKPSRHTKSEIEEPQRMTYSNIMIDLDMEQVAVGETDVDEVQLEYVDEDGLTNEIDMGYNIPTSADTYYNMESLIRSQVKVPQLLEYVRKKTDFETEFKKLLKGLQRSCDEALKPHNRKKNRYNGIYAYERLKHITETITAFINRNDATRVELQSKSYINANYIDGQNQSRAYIASLGPTGDTMNKYATFWEMIWQNGVEAIVMLTNLREGEKMKCEQYWPDQGMVMTCGKYNINCVAEQMFAEFVVRELVIQYSDSSEKHNVVQYHYTAWPDRSVPDSVVSLVAFRDKVEQRQRKTTSPLVVHCSAGIGRTGTYIALDILIKQGRNEDCVDIFGCAIGLRGQRVNMIQNENQYEYLHHCVLYALTCDTEPVKEVAINRQVTEERIAAQYKAMIALDSAIGRQSSRPTEKHHRTENRKGSDIPDDRYRVYLTSTKNGYINAVYMNGYIRKNQYIATQTPMPSTVQDFISMAYHENVQCIVCLDDENISDKTVGQYLPQNNKVCTFGKYTLLCVENNTTEEYIVRDLKLSHPGSPSFQDLKIRHFQFRGWKSKDVVPSDVKSFLKLIVEVNKNLNKRKSDCPVLVHCLTGAERTGIFCAVSTMLEILVIDKQLTGIHSISHVRDRRHSAIQTPEMIKFCYDCVKNLIDLSDNDPYYNMHSLGQ